MLTLVIAMFLVFEGIFGSWRRLTARYPHWGWVMFNGIISLVLGIMIWRQWPYSGLWVIGLFVGIEMLLNGWSLVMLSFSRPQASGRSRDDWAPVETAVSVTVKRSFFGVFDCRFI